MVIRQECEGRWSWSTVSYCPNIRIERATEGTNNIKSFFIIVGGVRLSPLGTAATTGLLYQHQMIDEGDCGEIGEIKIGKGNRSTRIKPAPAPLCPPQNRT
jgi:hypothetical protein